MSFEVVLCHFWNSGKNFSPILKPFDIARPMAVMVFMFTAFLLTGASIINRDKSKVCERIKRLIIMHIAWAMIYFVAYAAEALLFGKGIFVGRRVLGTVKDLVLQIILGHTFNATMWFQVDLIFISIVFAVMYYMMERKPALILTSFIGLGAFIVQYSGINSMLFGSMSYAFRYPLGRICEMLPLACAGLLFVNYGIMSGLSVHRTISIAVCAVLLVIAVKCRGFIPNAGGFGYSGLYLNAAAILMTIIFYLLPLGKLSCTARNFIRAVTCFSPGVYCMHRLAAECLRPLHVSNSFIFCIVIFIACLAVSFIISKFVGKTGRYLVA